MKITVKGSSYRNDENIKVNNVEIEGEVFKEVPNVSDYYGECNNCKYWRNCGHGDRVVRKFDCEKKANIVKTIFNIVTGIIVAIVAFLIYNKLNYSFFVETAALISFMVIFDALCCFIGFVVKSKRDKLFYKKLKKQKKEKEELLEKTKAEKEEKRKQEEMQAFIETFEGFNDDPNYSKITLAKKYSQILKKFIDSVDFGTYNEQINNCVQNLDEIVNILKEDNSRYNNLIELFEIYLPDFYKTLRLYSDFIKENKVRPEYEKILEKCIIKFNKYLEKVKQEATFERGSNEIQFETTAETLTNLIDAEGGSEE